MKIPFTNYQLDTSSIFKKRTPNIDDHFGVYFICGRQGSGKTYLAVQFLNNMNLKKVKIYTNVHSLVLPHSDFTKIEELYDNFEEHCCFVIDEISKKYHKNSPTDKDFYAWLNQSRKRKRIVILITQEWRELPMWIRRPAKIMISSKPTKILSMFGFVTQLWGDAENMIFDKDEGEYICPPIKYVIHKKNMDVARLYDTFEPIETL
ncbi:AAA family ATPase [Candidatus Saccharibacteria bacterium]|nr:AAA family ATPase [Candidatus Saccharibacteria bacterium]